VAGCQVLRVMPAVRRALVGFVKSVQLRCLRVLVDEATEDQSPFHIGVEIT
jgi:hypothetical protein